MSPETTRYFFLKGAIRTACVAQRSISPISGLKAQQQRPLSEEVANLQEQFVKKVVAMTITFRNAYRSAGFEQDWEASKQRMYEHLERKLVSGIDYARKENADLFVLQSDFL